MSKPQEAKPELTPQEIKPELTPQQIKNTVPQNKRKNDPRFIQNPFTNRWILKKSPTHIRLVHSGVFKDMDSTKPIKPVLIKPTTPAILEQHFLQNETPQTPEPIKGKLAETLTDIVAENKSKFVDLSEKETNKLLRKLLTLKLTKKKKKKKKKKIIVSSSDDSDSDSDSSESD